MPPRNSSSWGRPGEDTVSVVVPGIGVSDQAFLVSLAGIEKINIAHSGSRTRIVIDNALHAAAIVITQDHLAMHHLYRTIDEIKKEEACRLRYDVATRRLAHAAEIDAKLTELRHPLPTAPGSDARGSSRIAASREAA